MNPKIIVAGGLAMYVAQFVLSFATGPLVHEGILVEAYRANQQFWRPELNAVPPDMVALLPLWITTGIVGSLVLAGIYGAIRDGIAGRGWLSGLKFGLLVWLIQVVAMAGWSGVFNLPYEIWLWWGAEAVVYMAVGGAVLGLVAEKLSPRAAA
mgnify:FL=1